MNLLIQDTTIRCSYFLGQEDLTKFEVPKGVEPLDADVLFMIPNEFLLDEVPPARRTDGPVTRIAIVDSVANRTYQISRQDLEAFEIDSNAGEDPNTVTFAIPSSLDLMTEVPIFRRALLQYGS